MIGTNNSVITKSTQMTTSKIKFSLIVTGVLLISAFMPVLNILIMLLNGAVLSIFGDNNSIPIWGNLALSILTLFLFFRSDKNSYSILYGILSVLFLFPFFSYLFENSFSEDAPYFLQSLVGGILTGFILLFVSYLKNKLWDS
jgi:hypothetical protein